MKKFLHLNTIDKRYKVIDGDGFCFGDGATVEGAIASARIVTNEDIYTDYECDVVYDKGGE